MFHVTQLMKNEPAFPIPLEAENLGITRLEFFAAAALTGILAAVPDDADSYSNDAAAKWAFDIAESMCAEAERRLKP